MTLIIEEKRSLACNEGFVTGKFLVIFVNNLDASKHG